MSGIRKKCNSVLTLKGKSIAISNIKEFPLTISSSIHQMSQNLILAYVFVRLSHILRISINIMNKSSNI